MIRKLFCDTLTCFFAFLAMMLIVVIGQRGLYEMFGTHLPQWGVLLGAVALFLMIGGFLGDFMRKIIKCIAVGLFVLGILRLFGWDLFWQLPFI